MELFSLTTNFELITFGVSSTAILNLGLLIFLSDKKSITNRTFLYFTIAAFLWNLFNFLNFQFSTEQTILWSLRFVLFFSIWYSFFLAQLFYVFPEKTINFPRRYLLIRLPLAILVSFLTLSPFVFPQIAELAPRGQVSKTVVAPGIAIYGMFIFYLVGDGFYRIIKKIRHASPGTKNQYRYILIGAVFTFTLHIIFNFILPGIFLNVSFIPAGAAFTFPFITFTAYAILRHNFLDIKVIGTEFLIFTLWIFILIRALITNSTEERNLNLILFTLLLFVGYILIRSVRKEVTQREQLAIANKELGRLNEEKTAFLNFASHELRYAPTVIRNYASLFLEGSFGEMMPKGKETIQTIFNLAQGDLKLVDDYLNVSRIEQGRMKYEFKKVNVTKLLSDVVDNFQGIAQQTNTKVSKTFDTQKEVFATLDASKIGEVLNNLVDNAVEKYAKGTSVEVSLSEDLQNKKILIKLSDTGMGMSKETISKLFQRFARAKNVEKDVSGIKGSGLGLYLAKQYVQAHGGRIWADSAGEGKGSVFFLELPNVPPENTSVAFDSGEENKESGATT